MNKKGKIIIVGYVKRKHQGNLVYHPSGIAPTLCSGMGNMSGGSLLILVERKKEYEK